MHTYFESKSKEVLFIGIIIMAFVAFYIETDIYTPSFPAMMTYFGTNEESIQRLLSMNFIGLCLSCLFFGPASDAYGRKPILCIGLGIFALGSIGCSMTESLDWMIAYRFLQGFGCGSIVSAGLAMFFDVFPADKSSRLVSVCNGTLGGLMALAPIMGNWISLNMGWRANFYLVAINAILAFLCYVFFIKETLPADKRTPLNLNNVCKNYLSLLCNFPFMAHNIIWTLMFSMVIVFTANLSLIFVDHLNVPASDFGYYQATIMGAFFVGSMLCAYCIKKFGMFATKTLGNLLYIGGMLNLVYLSLQNINSPLLFIIALGFISLGTGLAITQYFTYSMNFIDERLKGSAMSLNQSLRLVISSGLVYIAGYYFDGSMTPITLLTLMSVLCGAVLYYFLYRKKWHFVPAT